MSVLAKELVKRSWDDIAIRSGIAAFGRRTRRAAPLVLTYHGLEASDERARPGCLPSDIRLPVDQFEAQLRHLDRHYRVVPLRAVLDWLAGAAPLPPNAVALTFDDGYLSVYILGFPLLKRFGFPATVFLTTDFVDRGVLPWWDVFLWALEVTAANAVSLPGPGGAARYPLGTQEERCRAAAAFQLHMHRTHERDRAATLAGLLDQLGLTASGVPPDDERFRPLTWSAIREMAEAGVEFGSHTVSHPVLAHLTEAERETELVESKRLIEENTGRPSDLFCYPYGWRTGVDASTRAQVMRAGYRCALTAVPGFVARGDDPFALKRLGTRSRFSSFSADMAGVSLFLLSVRAGVQG